jgi:hypothetical protein
VTVLFFEEAQKKRVLNKCEFFGGRGLPLVAPEGGSTLREQGRSFLVVMKTKL